MNVQEALRQLYEIFGFDEFTIGAIRQQNLGVYQNVSRLLGIESDDSIGQPSQIGTSLSDLARAETQVLIEFRDRLYVELTLVSPADPETGSVAVYRFVPL